MSVERFVGLDIHKNQITVAAVNAQQVVTLHPGMVRMRNFDSWAQAHLKKTDKIIFESTSNSWHLYDKLVELELDVVVANAHKIKLISSSRTKTDRQDALVLAKLGAANLVPSVWVPPMVVRELRGLISHYRRLLKERTATKNRLHSLLHRHGIEHPGGDIFSLEKRSWWLSLPLTPVECFRAQQDIRHLQHLDQLVVEAEIEMARTSVQEPWRSQMALLIQLPGIALKSGLTILSAIGDITRFQTPKDLVGYSGLGASIYASGESSRSGGITKQGRRELRQALVECAWITIRLSPHWQAVFQQYASRMSKNKAIVAIARKLLVVIWHVLTKRVADRYAEPEAVARSLYHWGGTHRAATSLGIGRSEFVWRELARLGMGADLLGFMCGGRWTRRPAAYDESWLTEAK